MLMQVRGRNQPDKGAIVIALNFARSQGEIKVQGSGGARVWGLDELSKSFPEPRANKQ